MRLVRPLSFCLILIGSAVAANRAAVWLFRPQALAESDVPAASNASDIRLLVPADNLNIGTVWENESFSWVLQVENLESIAVEVDRFSHSCDCLSVEPRSLTLGPGEKRALHLTIDLTSPTPPDGEALVRIVPQLKSGNRGPEWVIKGQVRRALTIDKQFYLGRHSELAQPLPPWTFPLKAEVPLERLEVQSDVPGLIASIRPPPSGTSNYTVAMELSKNIPVGSIEGWLSLTPTVKDGERLPARRVPVRGTVLPDLEAEPLVVQVGGRRIGDKFEEEITLRSLTGRPLGSVKASAEGQGLEVEPTDKTDRFRARQTVCLEGAQITRVRFTVRLGGQHINITVPVEYTGIGEK